MPLSDLPDSRILAIGVLFLTWNMFFRKPSGEFIQLCARPTLNLNPQMGACLTNG